MRSESYFLELKRYCNVPLVFDYQIEEITYEFFNTKIKTNKWIDFTVWLKIQEKLEEILKRNLVDFDSEELLLSNNSVCVLIVKHSLENRYAKIFEFRADEMQPFIIRINIKQNKHAVQLNNNVYKEYNNPREKITHELDIYEDNSIVEKVAENENKSIVQLTHAESHTSEYNPLSPRTKLRGTTELVTNENDFVPYKPSTQNETTDDKIVENDPYSPRAMDLTPNPGSQESNAESPDLFSEKDANIIPKYKASPILNKTTELNKSTKKNKKTSREIVRKESQRSTRTSVREQQSNKKRPCTPINKSVPNSSFNEKKKTIKSKQLFGSDESDESDDSNSDTKFQIQSQTDSVKKAKADNKLKTSMKKNYYTAESDDSVKLKQKKIKLDYSGDGQNGNLDKWLNSGKISTTDKNNKMKLSKKTNLNKNINEATTSKISTFDQGYQTGKKLSEEERRVKFEQYAKEINALNNYNNQLKQLNKSPTQIDFKTLNHINIDKILKNFRHYKPLLDQHFKEYKSQKSHHIKAIKGLDHIALLNIVGESHQLKMLNCLKENYEPDDIPCYTELFMTLMLPEWILALFMNEYQLTRENAIQRLKDQEDSLIYSQMNNSIFNFSNI